LAAFLYLISRIIPKDYHDIRRQRKKKFREEEKMDLISVKLETKRNLGFKNLKIFL